MSVFAVRCRYRGTLLLSAPRIGYADAEAASIVEHLREHVVFGWQEEPTFSELLRVFMPAVRDAKLEDFHWDDLRHTFASRLVMAGVDIRTVLELLGHKTLAMTMRHSHLSPAHKLDAVQRRARRVGAPVGDPEVESTKVAIQVAGEVCRSAEGI